MPSEAFALLRRGAAEVEDLRERCQLALAHSPGDRATSLIQRLVAALRTYCRESDAVYGTLVVRCLRSDTQFIERGVTENVRLRDVLTHLESDASDASRCWSQLERLATIIQARAAIDAAVDDHAAHPLSAPAQTGPGDIATTLLGMRAWSESTTADTSLWLG